MVFESEGWLGPSWEFFFAIAYITAWSSVCLYNAEEKNELQEQVSSYTDFPPPWFSNSLFGRMWRITREPPIVLSSNANRNFDNSDGEAKDSNYCKNI